MTVSLRCDCGEYTPKFVAELDARHATACVVCNRRLDLDSGENGIVIKEAKKLCRSLDATFGKLD